MDELIVKTQGRAGRITLNRPSSFNAMNYAMCGAIEAQLEQWRDDPSIALIILDAAGDKAFCAGGDLVELYNRGLRADYKFGQTFWRDEYRLNRKIAEYPKPIVSFMQGFTMGGGVGLGCHAAHRVVCESSIIAMPECGIGLVPDVGGSYILAKAPGFVGRYLGLSAARMSAGDAIYARFADHYIPRDQWDRLIETLSTEGDLRLLIHNASPAPRSELAAHRPWIDSFFSKPDLATIFDAIGTSNGTFVEVTYKQMARNCPLAMGVALEIQNRLKDKPHLARALDLEYRYTYRAQEFSDFQEGIRAAVIDKDRRPEWRYHPTNLPFTKIEEMLAPIPAHEGLLKGNMMKIAFIGLGNMGAPMAQNLAEAGYEVTGYDQTPVKLPRVTPAPSARDAVKGADIVITMLPNGQIVQNVADDILEVMRPDAILVDCSTIDVDGARKIAKQAQTHDVMMLDAPVSGGVVGATAGNLTFMVGGTVSALDKVKPLFDVMGQRAVHCGDAGNGQAAKICNNMILGATMIATCEAFALADKLGLERQSMFDVVSTSSGYSWSMNSYCPAPGIGPQSPADSEYKPGFAAELMLKDLNLAQEAAISVDADTPMGARARDLYTQFVEQEDGRGKDFSAMLPRFVARSRS